MAEEGSFDPLPPPSRPPPPRCDLTQPLRSRRLRPVRASEMVGMMRGNTLEVEREVTPHLSPLGVADAEGQPSQSLSTSREGKMENETWSRDAGGDWESVRASDSTSQYWPGKPDKRIMRPVLADQEAAIENENLESSSRKGKEPADQAELFSHFSALHLDQVTRGSQADQPTLLPYKSIIEEKLGSRIPSLRPAKAMHKEIVTILFCWDEDFHLYDMLINRLRDVLYHKYGSAICKLHKIPHVFSHGDVLQYVEKTLEEHSHRETLIVVYYIGGATTVKQSREGLVWFPLNNKSDPDRGSVQYPKVYWEMMQRNLQKTESDVLLLMDTCGYFGTPPTSQSRWEPMQGTTELIGSFEWQDTHPTTVSTGFTRLLTNALVTRYNKSKVFSAADLHCDIVSIYNTYLHDRLKTQVVPFFMRLSGYHENCSILLKPLAWPNQVVYEWKRRDETGSAVAEPEMGTAAVPGPEVKKPEEEAVAGLSRLA